MGFLGGRLDFLGQRVVEVLNTVPQFFLIITLIATFRPSLTLLVIISVIFQWIPISYYVRGEFLKNRKREFVEAARALGERNGAIIFKHILPNSLAPVITFAPFCYLWKYRGTCWPRLPRFWPSCSHPKLGRAFASSTKKLYHRMVVGPFSFTGPFPHSHDAQFDGRGYPRCYGSQSLARSSRNETHHQSNQATEYPPQTTNQPKCSRMISWMISLTI